MEDNATRAIIIGVGLFIILLVITGVILYVNAARNMASIVNKSINTWDDITYSNIMEYNGDVTINCTGMDFVNFVRENFMREDIYVTMVAEDTVILDKVNMSYWKSEHSNNVSELKLASISVDSNVIMRKKTVTDENGVNTYYITVQFKAKNGENAIKAGQKVPLNNGETTIYYKVMYSKNEAINSIGGIVYSGGSAVKYTLGEPEIKDSANSCNIYAIKYGKEVGLISTNYKTYINAVITYKKYGQVSAKSVEFEFEFEKDNTGSKPEKPTPEEVVVPTDVVIPAGFYYVGGTKDTGLVISDNASDFGKGIDYTCVGNQFVWVPVEDYSKYVRSTTQGIDNDSGSESVRKYKGFYIARFQAGDGDATTERTTYTAARTVVSKKSAYVYNYVTSSSAISLASSMYKNSASVISSLCSGVKWDVTMNFISAGPKNIYGLTDNVGEWTSEREETWTGLFVGEGDSYYRNIYRKGTNRNGMKDNTVSANVGFRIVLCLK